MSKTWNGARRGQGQGVGRPEREEKPGTGLSAGKVPKAQEGRDDSRARAKGEVGQHRPAPRKSLLPPLAPPPLKKPNREPLPGRLPLATRVSEACSYQ